MFPNGVTRGFQGLGLQLRLREQASEEARQSVAASTLAEQRISCRVHENLAGAAAHERVVSFEDHPAIAVSAGDFTQRGNSILLDDIWLGSEEARCFTGMRREEAAGVQRGGAGFDPLESGRIHDHWERRSFPMLVCKFFPLRFQNQRGEAGANEQSGAVGGKIC